MQPVYRRLVEIRRSIPFVSSGVRANHRVQFRSTGCSHLQLARVEDIAHGNGIMVFFGETTCNYVVDPFT